MKLLRALAIVCAVVMVIITIVPAEERPVTGLQHDLEHFAAFALPGLLFGYAYATRIWVLSLASILFALVVELAQIPLPTRHARFEDFLVDAAGMCLGVLIGRLMQVGPRQASPRLIAVIIRLTALMLVLAVLGGLVAYWPQLKIYLADVTPVASHTANPPKVPEQPMQQQSVAKVELPASVAATPSASDGPGFPLPSSFGVYVLSEGQLSELSKLPGKVPDPRVAISAAINSPSQTVVARGNVKLIVFRRAAAVANEPPNVQVRMMAKVMWARGADGGGKPVKSQVQDSWVIRGNTFPYSASPIAGHPEMYLIQPETTDFALLPGRYALVIRGQGFDFSVAGAISDPQQCVERADGVNSVFYAPCRTR